MAITHGINTSKQATSVSTPVTVATGVHFVVGAAPVQMVGGKVNEVIMLNTCEEAVQLLGYSDDWQKYDLCMEIYSAFQLYNVALCLWSTSLTRRSTRPRRPSRPPRLWKIR